MNNSRQIIVLFMREIASFAETLNKNGLASDVYSSC